MTAQRWYSYANNDDLTTSTTDGMGSNSWGNGATTAGPTYVVYARVKKIEQIAEHDLGMDLPHTKRHIDAPTLKALPRKHQVARHGFQQMCRIPCYRGGRTR